MQEISVIITAGGIGKRMGTSLPKQFLLLAGEPILMRTLQQLNNFLPSAQIIITLPEEWKTEWEKLCNKYSCHIPHEIISGGEERFHSVKNALNKCKGEIVFIHDGVRPLVTIETINRGLEAIQYHNAAVPFLPIQESLRKVENDRNQNVNRAQYAVIQTPQVFKTKEIVSAYEVNFAPSFTDDASVMEQAGHHIHLFEGNKENVKITQQSDLALAEFYWSQH